MANDLHYYIKEKIVNDGVMPLAKFIETALGHPQLGYYSKEKLHPIGVKGDFITAPEISQMFGEMIGVWAIDIWKQLGCGAINLIEFGPGRGTLMADILRVAQKTPNFIQKVHISFIETSPSLINTQKKAVNKYIEAVNISWNKNLSDIKGSSIILGNEFLDVLPIEQVIKKKGIWFQKTVNSKEKSFFLDEKILNSELKPYLPVRALDNKLYEISPSRINFIKDCAKIIKMNAGAALFIDYGHIKSCPGNTLQAVKNHKYAKILENVGNSDITSHVDFETLERAVKDMQVDCANIITQGKFLENIGIIHRANVLAKNARANKKELDIALERLIGKKQMGELFKVLCFHSANIKPEGF